MATATPLFISPYTLTESLYSSRRKKNVGKSLLSIRTTGRRVVALFFIVLLLFLNPYLFLTLSISSVLSFFHLHIHIHIHMCRLLPLQPLFSFSFPLSPFRHFLNTNHSLSLFSFHLFIILASFLFPRAFDSSTLVL